MSKRKAFNFFVSYFDVYNELNDTDKVQFMDALLNKQFYGIEPEKLTGMAKFAYISQKFNIDGQVKGWEDKTRDKLHPPTEPPIEPPTEGGLTTPTVQEKVKGKEKVKEKGEVKVKEKEIKMYSEEVHDCFYKCLESFDDHLHPKDERTKNNWLDTLEKLNTIEKIPFDKIVEIVKKTRNDNFWSKNFLSLTKLRKKNNDGICYIVVFNEQTRKKETSLQSMFNKIDSLNLDNR